MKKLSFKEFDQKSRDVIKARKIFIKSCVTKNLTVAYELYKEVLAEENQDNHYEFFIDVSHKCPKCGNNKLKKHSGCGHFEKHEYCEVCDYERIIDGGD